MYSYLLEELSKAIGARLLVQFHYKDEKHVVEPHLLGHTHQNEDCLCAWLISKDGKAAEGWHCFDLKQMRQTQLLDNRFTKKRPGYDPYNNTMNRIYYRI
ncbi:hypothetical protein [Pontibacter akesuensis]|uniref:WYL domain-containing protein n=1 Tax=Pontibacter akesuensis TaxID=388950 RepID=A0A1I7JP69_9BACT|nr:hypothetical protein [Pontibacter akesuensis]GHA68500.1 hypothetical protein GCM10007389_21870 [Pontibacter akesuensis]SFU86994.1 hypothetical protein SAMN04487941_3090 [Pontibacter akesuensis]